MSKLKTLADEKLNVVLRCCDEKKTLWEKQKMLDISIFCLSHNILADFLKPLTFLEFRVIKTGFKPFPNDKF